MIISMERREGVWVGERERDGGGEREGGGREREHI